MKSSFLFKQLEKKSPDLAGRVVDCWGEAEKLLRHVPAVHQYYTSHGPDHALALIRILGDAIKPIKLSLTDEELYILISATLLHDIGMVGTAGAGALTRERYRNEHHTRTHSYILKNWKEIYIKKGYQKIIASVSASHRKINIDKFIIERKIKPDSSAPPRAKLCAALLRLADECHITDDRVPEDYSVLNLPEESLKHFDSHFNTTNLMFDHSTENIIFSITVDSPDMDSLIKAAKKKIQEELNGLQPIFTKHKIPYKNIVLDEDRDSLIRYKLIRQLLLDGGVDSTDIVGELVKQGEEKEKVENYLSVFGQATPFEVVVGELEKLYKLSYCLDSFNEIKKTFLFDVINTRDPLVFIKSDLAKNILSDTYLGGMVGHRISLKTPKEIVYSLIRKSPSALRYVLKSQKEPVRKSISGTGGMFGSLKAELQNDFVSYPELLLEPGLLDDVFDSEKHKDVWSNLKVEQICQYHKVFDEEKLREQWVLPNKWDHKACPDNRTNTHNIKTTFTFDRNCENPMHMMTAAYRMKLPCRFEATQDFNIDILCDSRPLSDNKQEGAVMMEMNPSGGKIPSTCFFPARFEKKRGGKYLIEVFDGQGNDDCVIQNHPFVIRLQIDGNPIKDGNNLCGNSRITLQTNWDILDCKQANLMTKVRGCQSIELYSNKLDQKIGDLSFDNNEGKKIFGPIGDKEFEKVIGKLERLQCLLHINLPFPLGGLSDEIYKLLLDCSLRSKNDAQYIWDKVQGIISKEKKRFFSTISAQTVHDGHTLRYRYLDCVHGVHFPNINVEFTESKCANPQEMLKKALDDPKQKIDLSAGDITLSPQSAIEFFKENKITYGNKKVVNPVDFKEIMASSPEEHNTRVTFKWLPEKDCIWYKVTPFVLQLEKLTWQRWIIESDYLSKVLKDVERAHIATKEAFRMEPQNSTVLVSHGWSAFNVGRLDEAIEVTKKCETANDKECKSISFMNLGLYYLTYSLCDSENIEKHQIHAREWYVKAIESLELLSEDECQFAIQSAINDILEYRNKLDDIADEFLKLFQDISLENISIEEAKIMSEDLGQN